MNKRIIIDANETVTCPDCGHAFPLHLGITQHTIERYEDEFESAMATERKQLEERLSRDAQRAAEKTYLEQVADLKTKLDEKTQAEEGLKRQIQAAAEKAAQSAKAESEDKILELEEQLQGKADRLQEYQKRERELRLQKEALEEAKGEFDLRLARELEAKAQEIGAKAEQVFQLKEAELKKKISDAERVSADLQRKLDQGSQQLQGEVLELELEDLLAAGFPFDGIEAIAKGARGADVVQKVTTRSGSRCGQLIWEAKRARNWSNDWVQKLKDDQQAVGAEIAVLVTTVFPNGAPGSFMQHDGVWLVRPDTIQPVAHALRAILVEAQKQKVISANRSEKAEALYDYLCSPQFAQKVRGVVDAHDAMKADLEAEKKAMARLWKKREGQLERITTNIIGMAGELQGISQESLTQLDSIAMFPVAESA